MVVGLGRCKYLELAGVLGRLTRRITSAVQSLAHRGSRIVVEYRRLS